MPTSRRARGTLGRVDSGASGELTPVAARDLIGPDAILLDVREDHEWAAGHAPQATHMPMSRIPQLAVRLPADKTIICVCHVGARSAAVAAALNQAGWTARNLAGGMAAWAAAGLPVVSSAGNPGVIV